MPVVTVVLVFFLKRFNLLFVSLSAPSLLVPLLSFLRTCLSMSQQTPGESALLGFRCLNISSFVMP